ncbi:hypothetical protein M885DRAFT_522085 [Pelagophyceae sp. CCMP2097]|nr:hypothetical protein M885DRAFT_522085 [Pelagophyceae sp. CCMP2097]
MLDDDSKTSDHVNEAYTRHHACAKEAREGRGPTWAFGAVLEGSLKLRAGIIWNALPRCASTSTPRATLWSRCCIR